jgi:hypothetical protein
VLSDREAARRSRRADEVLFFGVAPQDIVVKCVAMLPIVVVLWFCIHHAALNLLFVANFDVEKNNVTHEHRMSISPMCWKKHRRQCNQEVQRNRRRRLDPSIKVPFMDTQR